MASKPKPKFKVGVVVKIGNGDDDYGRITGKEYWRGWQGMWSYEIGHGTWWSEDFLRPLTRKERGDA